VLDAFAGSAAQAVADASLVVLAGPVGSIVPTARAIADALSPGALVLDLGSVKAAIVDETEAALPHGRFVGCHPLAGTEATGVAAADAELYRGKPCFVCPGRRTQPAAVDDAERVWRAIGAQPVRLAPGPHDELMAAASHLPHVAAFALAASLADSAERIRTALPSGANATSLRDTTRIAASSPTVWRDIFLANAERLLPHVVALEARVAELRAAIETRDGAALERLLRAGQGARRALFPS
jgi:prephenate dehydrogenase